MPQTLSVYIPMDRRHALAQGVDLPQYTTGAALFADVSGFTPLTEALTRTLGPRRGAEELTRQLNEVYDALITEVHRYRGSVLGFAGDAITCWFSDPVDAPVLTGSALRAVACAEALQRAMQSFESIALPVGETVSLAMKVAIASGPARRFLVGDPNIQLIDVLAGETLTRMAAAEHYASRGEIVLDVPTTALLDGQLQFVEWRTDEETGNQFAVLSTLLTPVEPAPWPLLDPNVLSEVQERSWLLPAVYDRLHEGLGEFLTELRPAVTVFLRFQGIDYDNDADAGPKLDAYIRWVQSVFTRYEGSLLQLIIGDKGNFLYGSFGAPIAHEDDAWRAAVSALELRSLPAALDFIHSIQIGISQGTMRTGAYGGTMRRTYGVIGDEVNLSARLMQHAAPGEILVSSRVQRMTKTAFVYAPLSPVRVKGKQEPIPVSRLLGRQQVPTETAFYTSSLVGREAELTQIRPVLASVLAGEGKILRLVGGAGVGKSHLAAEFAAEVAAQNVQVCFGACHSTTQHIAYAPWKAIFRTLLGLTSQSLAGEDAATAHASEIAHLEAVVNKLNPDWHIRLPLLGDLLDLPIPDNTTTAAFDPRLRQETFFALAVELVQTVARNRMLLLLVEDAHWMDEASLGLTLALARTVIQSPVLLMLVQRPPVQADKLLLPELDQLAGYHTLNLTELSPEGIAALTTNRLKAAVSPLVVSLVQIQSQGNPFFAEELIDALREANNLILQDGKWMLSNELVNALHKANCLETDPISEEQVLRPGAQLSAVSLNIPDSVHSAVLTRLDRLPELYKLTLKVASVIGRVFEREILARANPTKPGLKALQQQLDLFEQRDFARLEVPPPRVAYMFKHNMTQEVVYETLLETQKCELHRAVGTLLEQHQPEAVEQLAYHFYCGDVRYKTLFYLDKAAHQAQRKYANQTALNYYNQALALEDLAEWHKEKIEILHILGRREEECATLQALETRPDASAYEIAHLWGQYYEAVSDYIQAQAAVERALAISRAQANRVSEANSLTYLGLIARRQGEYERAKAWYQQALTLFQEDEVYSPEEAIIFAQALNGLGIVQRQQSDYEEAIACYQRALTLSQQNGDRRGEAEALHNLGGIAFYQRDFSDAQAFYRQALEIRRTIGDRAGEGNSLFNMAAAMTDVGDYAKAQEYFSATLSIQQATGNRWEEGNAWNGLGILHFTLGDLEKAEMCSRRGLQIAREIGDEAGEAYLLGNLGQVMRDRGEMEVAETLLNDGLALVQKQNDKYQIAYLLSHLGLVNLFSGKFECAIEFARAALTIRREIDLELWTTADLAVLAASHLALQDTAKALTYAEQTLTMLDECGGEGPEFPHQDYFICYQVLQAIGKIEMARKALQSAHQLVVARAEKITDPALRESFLKNVPINRQIIEATTSNWPEQTPTSRTP
jgi:adenylate cyclase